MVVSRRDGADVIPEGERCAGIERPVLGPACGIPYRVPRAAAVGLYIRWWLALKTPSRQAAMLIATIRSENHRTA
jgi:hypothetical protein